VSWTHDRRTVGFCRLSGDPRGEWRLYHRKASGDQREGWYLYGPDGVPVVGEWMAERIATAQRAAERFVNRYEPEAAADAAQSAANDQLWQQLLEEVG
jgi:hypothetical protein